MQGFEIISKNEEETSQLAAQIAKSAEVCDVFALYGTLGMGKSVFARSFIKSLCKETEEVPSPTFTLLQVYEAKYFDIYHFDMYRIKSPEEIFELGIEDAYYNGVSLIEWPEKMEKYLPQNTIKIKFEILDGDKRRIMISCENSNQLLRIKQHVKK